MKKPRIFHVDEAEAAVLLYTEDNPLPQEEFDQTVQSMRRGIQEIDRDATEEEETEGL